MGHHRDAALGEEANGLGHPGPAFELDRAAAGFLQDSRRGAEGLLAAFLVGAERQVDDDERPLRSAHHRKPLQDHHVEGDGDGGFHPVHHHPEGIADQDHVRVLIDQAGRMRMVGGQHDDRLTALAGADVGSCQAADIGLSGHGKL